MYRIAVGGQACRTVNDADLYVDRYALSETSGHTHLQRKQVLHDPTDDQLVDRLALIPDDDEIEVYSSMQGRYSLATVPKILAALGNRHRTYIKQTLVPENIRRYIAGFGAMDLAREQTAPGKVPTSIQATAFVSYAWETTQHKTWVADLCKRLAGDGIGVVLDIWNTAPGDELPQFMESAIRDSDFVLLICTPTYKRKADHRVGGVGFEGHIITATALVHGNERKFVPILRGPDWVASAPTWALGKRYLDFSGDPYAESEYMALCEALRRPIARNTPSS